MDNIDIVSLFNTLWPVLLTVSVIAVLAPKVPDLGWKVLAVLPGAVIVSGGLLMAFATVATGGDTRVNGIFLLQLIVGGGWSFWWGCHYWEKYKASS